MKEFYLQRKSQFSGSKVANFFNINDFFLNISFILFVYYKTNLPISTSTI